MAIITPKISALQLVKKFINILIENELAEGMYQIDLAVDNDGRVVKITIFKSKS